MAEVFAASLTSMSALPVKVSRSGTRVRSSAYLTGITSSPSRRAGARGAAAGAGAGAALAAGGAGAGAAGGALVGRLQEAIAADRTSRGWRVIAAEIYRKLAGGPSAALTAQALALMIEGRDPPAGHRRGDRRPFRGPRTDRRRRLLRRVPRDRPRDWRPGRREGAYRHA